MRDGRTRQMAGRQDAGGEPERAIERFMDEHRTALVVVRGPDQGSEREITAPRVLIGRSASATLRLEHGSVSHEHAVLELGPDGFSMRDLGSTNGVQVNGQPLAGAELEHGDRLAIGEFELQLVVEPKASSPVVWQLNDETDTTDSALV